jgi:hypothetical protein
LPVNPKPMGFYDAWLFPRVLDLVMQQKQMIPFRERVGKAASGRVLDIGIGYIRLTLRSRAELESSAWASATRIDEPHRSWRFEITGFQLFDPKAGGLHQIVRFAIEMAATRHTLPYWREPVLPTSHANFRRTPVLGSCVTWNPGCSDKIERWGGILLKPANFPLGFGGVYVLPMRLAVGIVHDCAPSFNVQGAS